MTIVNNYAINPCKVFGLFYGFLTFCKSLMLVMLPKNGRKRDKFVSKKGRPNSSTCYVSLVQKILTRRECIKELYLTEVLKKR